MSELSNDPRSENDSQGGQGGPAPRDESGLRPAEQNKLIGMALNRRFPLTESSVQIAVETTERNMESKDGKVSNGAVANMIKMVAINQKEDHEQAAANRPSNPMFNINGPVQVYLPANQR